MSELSSVYSVLAKKLDKSENMSEIAKTLEHTDKMVNRAIGFIIENSVLPRMESLKRVVH